MKRFRAIVYSSCVVLFAPVAAGQTTLFSDDFTDGNILSNPAWYAFGAGVAVEDDAGLGTGNALRIDIPAESGSRYLHTEFPEVTLGAVGDYIEVTFDVRVFGPASNVGSLLRFGLYDTNGTSSADGASPSDGFGYYAAADVGGRVSTLAYDLRRNRVLGVFNTLSGPDEFGGTASNNDSYAVTFNDAHTAKFRIERTEDPFDQVPDLLVSTVIKGPGDDELADVSNNVLAEMGIIDTFSFGDFNIGTRSAPQAVTFMIDNVNVVTNLVVDIPDPPIPGDFNSDTVVDGEDLTDWIAAFGQTAGADADEDGDSDGNDFLIWQRNIGASAQTFAAAGAVPEPNSLALVAAAATGALWRRRRTR